MEEWKQAFWLAKFEMRESMKGFIFLCTMFGIIVSGIIVSFNTYLDKGFAGFDLYFLLLFLFMPGWVRPKEFQLQKIGNKYVEPSVVLFQQLPIPRTVIVKNRIVVYFVYTFPIQLLSFILIYWLTPGMASFVSPLSYTAFSVIWLSFGMYVGYMVPAIDIGEKKTGGKWAIPLAMLLLIAALFLLAFFQLFFKVGLVHYVLQIAQSFPMFSIIVSLLLAYLGVRYWLHTMTKQINEMDYL